VTGLTLAIETSNPSAWTPDSPARPGVAVARAGEVLGVEAIDVERVNEDDLAPAIARLFGRLGLKARDLRSLAVSVGPGGFTAVRLAVTTAKMIAEATGAQCLPIPSAWVVARRVRSGEPFAVALASKGESAFVTIFDAEGKPGEGQLLESAGLTGLGVRLVVADQFFPDSMRDAAGRAGLRVEPPVFDPVACLEAAVGVTPVDPAALLPLYPREPEAVTKWKKLHPPG
jgi:tRNA threonylcarbamoyl adenosine modification protein YeaZ